MPGNELSLDEIYASASAPDEGRFIDPKAQAGRDEEARKILQAEYQDPRKADSRDAVKKEYQRRFPGKPLKDSQELSLDDIYNETGGTGSAYNAGGGRGRINPGMPTESPRQAKKPGYWAQRGQEGKQIARNFADLGDMVLSTPGGLAANAVALGGQLKDQVLESFKEKGKTHEQIGKETLEKNNELAERWSTNVLARAVNAVLPEKEGEVSPHDVQEAAGWLTQKIEHGAEFGEKATGKKLTKEEINLEAQLLMNLAGTKGLVKAGGKLWTKDTAPKVAPTPEPKPAKPSVDFKTFQEFMKEQRENEAKAKPAEAKPAEPPKPEEVEKKQKIDYKAYRKHLEEVSEKQVDEVAQKRAERVAKVAEMKERPTDPADQKVHDANEPLKASIKKSAQAGGITPEQAWNIAALSLGAAAGAYLDPENPLVSGFHGMLTATMATVPGLKAGRAVAKGAIETLRGTGKPPVDQVRATPLVEARNGQINAGNLAAYRAQVAIHKWVPDLTQRQVLAHAIDQGKWQTLTGPMRQAADHIHKMMVDIGTRALKEGVLKGLVDNYISHIVAPKDVAKAQALFNSRLMGGASTTSPFAKARSVPTIAQLKAAGIAVLTEDAGEIIGIYMRSMEEAIANKQFTKNLQMTKIPGGNGLMAYPVGKAPPHYVDAGIPGVRVHPDLEASVGFMFEARDLNGIAAAGLAFNTTIKRLEVMNPLFHFRSLLEARIGSNMNWPKAVKEGLQAVSPRVFGMNEALKQMREGPAGDRVEKLLRKGLQVSFEHASDPLDSDIRGNFYRGMGALQSALDKHVHPIAGVPVRLLMKINHKVDNMLWGRGQGSWKVGTALEESEKLLRNAGKRGKFMTEEEADSIAVSMNNMRYGSLDWHMLAEKTNNRFLRNTAFQLFNEKGRAAMGVLAFAPDWKASTLGAFIAMFQKGSGARGLWQPTTLADLARQQQIRTAIYYFTVVNGINYALSGHYLWDNGKDGKHLNWMWIDRGDGTKMSGSKHGLEPYHFMENPGNFAVSSMGVIPSELLDQATHRDYNYVGRNKKGEIELQGPRMEGSRINHALKRLAPIGTPDFSQGMGPIAWGIAGYNVYGKTPEQRRQEGKARREAEFKRRLEQYKKSSDPRGNQGGGQR